jgi:retron-type reverse transcriptase
VRAVPIPKHDGKVRMLGVPTVADRIAQTVVAARLEARVEPMFHPDSYGYRPNRSALDAVAVTLRRCWSKDWVLDLDIRAFFDSVDDDLLIKAVEANTEDRWVELYVRRWLTAPMAYPDGTVQDRDRGTPQVPAAVGDLRRGATSSLPRLGLVGSGLRLPEPARPDRLDQTGNHRRTQAPQGLAGETECRR